MKKIGKRIITLFVSTIVLGAFGSIPVMANEAPVMTVTITNNSNGDKQTTEIPVDCVPMTRANGEQILEGEVYVKIPENGSDGIELMDAARYGSTTDSSSNQNIYWKATVSVTYSADDTYCTFSKAGASWTQLRGSSSLSNRKVYWGYTLGLKQGGKTNYPTSNSVSYNTGLGAMKYGNGSLLGCNSSVLITLDNGLSMTLEANIQKDL